MWGARPWLRGEASDPPIDEPVEQLSELETRSTKATLAGNETVGVPGRLFRRSWAKVEGVMSWKCVLGFHSPSLVSISRKPDGLHALCEGCALPLDRNEEARWKPAQPLVFATEPAGEAP